MKLASYYLISYVFVFLLQAGSSDVDKTQCSFSFPNSIKALKNSNVTIPCTFTASINHSEVNVIWFKFHVDGFRQVFNWKDPSKVVEEYRGRTSLVANGTDSCALRIKNVTKTERLYPGISEEINSYNLYKFVQVQVTDCSGDPSCHDWTFRFPVYAVALKGSCVEIPCTFTRPDDAKDFNFLWYSIWEWEKIFDNKTPSDVVDEFKGRTFLTGNTENDCSLQITNVKQSGEYFPGVNKDINAIMFSGRNVKVTVYGDPPYPVIRRIEEMEDKKTFNISCSVYHTCPSNPPTITWSITGHPIMEREEFVHYQGKWRTESIMTYTASYRDDKAVLQCAATFPNNKTSVREMTLNIKYDSSTNYIYLAFLGIICLAVLALIAYFCRRKKSSQRLQSPEDAL